MTDYSEYTKLNDSSLYIYIYIYIYIYKHTLQAKSLGNPAFLRKKTLKWDFFFLEWKEILLTTVYLLLFFRFSRLSFHIY